MKTSWKFVIACGLVLMAAAAGAQERPAITAPPNSVYVGADGKFESAPDTAVVQFGIAAQEATSKAAYERASKAAEQVRQVLRANGVDPKSAEVGFLSVQPVYDWKNPKRKLIAYRVNTSVVVKLKDFSKIGPIVQQMADIDVTENQTLGYELQDIDAAKAKAVQDAFQRARASAQVVAQASGRQLGQLSYASVDTFEPVHIMPAQRMTMKAMGAESAPPAPTEEFSAQKITVTAHVNALFDLK